MMSLKEYMLWDNKKNVYDFYVKINSKAEKYEKISRNSMYLNIISFYRNDPEIILRLCTMEEIEILKKLLNERILKRDIGYIEYLLFQNLTSNYLVMLDNNEYYIPSDLINYVKMAINLLDEEEYSKKDVVDSVIIGVVRAYNVLSLNEVILLLKEYSIYYDLCFIKKEIKRNPKWIDKVEVVRYKNENYIISKEFLYFKEVLELRKTLNLARFSLEELISFGKYKINLFQENILYFLNFLETYFNPETIDSLLSSIIVYCGLGINDKQLLNQICDFMEDVLKETKMVIPYFPVWTYYGNCLLFLKENNMC